MNNQSLADYLGTSDSTAAPDAETPPAAASLKGKEFAQAVLDSQEFRDYIVASLKLGEIPSVIVVRMMDYAWGKPVERLEVHDSTLDELTPDLVKSKLLRVQRMLQLLDGSDAGNDDDHGDNRVH